MAEYIFNFKKWSELGRKEHQHIFTHILSRAENRTAPNWKRHVLEIPDNREQKGVPVVYCLMFKDRPIAIIAATIHKKQKTVRINALASETGFFPSKFWEVSERMPSLELFLKVIYAGRKQKCTRVEFSAKGKRAKDFEKLAIEKGLVDETGKIGDNIPKPVVTSNVHKKVLAHHEKLLKRLTKPRRKA